MVADGRVECLDLRIRPELLAPFVECLVDDVGDDRAKTALSRVTGRKGLDVAGGAPDETD